MGCKVLEVRFSPSVDCQSTSAAQATETLTLVFAKRIIDRDRPPVSSFLDFTFGDHARQDPCS